MCDQQVIHTNKRNTKKLLTEDYLVAIQSTN